MKLGADFQARRPNSSVVISKSLRYDVSSGNPELISFYGMPAVYPCCLAMSKLSSALFGPDLEGLAEVPATSAPSICGSLAPSCLRGSRAATISRGHRETVSVFVCVREGFRITASRSDVRNRARGISPTLKSLGRTDLHFEAEAFKDPGS